MVKEKLNSRKGFTLAELLIVVAIISILVAIMIPVFSGARANAILARDTANMRSAYAEEVVKALSSAKYGDSGRLNVTINIDPLKLDKDTSLQIYPAGFTVIYPKATNGNYGDNDRNMIYVDPDVKLTLIANKSEYSTAGDIITLK